MCIFIAATTIGPLLGPIISGFISPAVGWRWSFWIGFLIAGVSWIPLLFLPETYAPVILQHRAAQIRKTTNQKNTFAPLELEPKGWRSFLTVVLARPMRMFFTEAIVLFTCLYLALIYAVYFMFFQSYPIIFQGAQSYRPIFLPLIKRQRLNYTRCLRLHRRTRRPSLPTQYVESTTPLSKSISDQTESTQSASAPSSVALSTSSTTTSFTKRKPETQSGPRAKNIDASPSP